MSSSERRLVVSGHQHTIRMDLGFGDVTFHFKFGTVHVFFNTNINYMSNSETNLHTKQPAPSAINEVNMPRP